MQAIVDDRPVGFGQSGQQKAQHVNPSVKLRRWNHSVTFDYYIDDVVGDDGRVDRETQQFYTCHVESVC